MTTDSLRLLRHLRTLDADALGRVLTERHVPLRSIAEPLDLAEQLCRPDAVEAALRRLPLTQLLGLNRSDPEALSRATELALAVPADEESPSERAETTAGLGVTLLQVTVEALQLLLKHTPDFPERQLTGTPSDATGTLPAFESTQLASDILWEIGHRELPLRTDRTGLRLRNADLRRIANLLPEAEPSLVVALGALLADAGLVAPAETSWAMTAAGERFLGATHADRWQQLAQTWYDQLDPAVLHPDPIALGDIPLATELGIIDLRDGVIQRTPLGAMVLSGAFDQATAFATEQFPTPVREVYLQPDSTIVAPGPLSGEADARLREIALLEHRALASQYRLTEDSIMSALRAGQRAEEITETLEHYSCTGVPQPVTYLISNCAKTFGDVRVRAHDRGAVIRAKTDAIHEALRVDAALAILGPNEQQRGGRRWFTTRVAPETALTTLIQARYPAALEDEHGTVITRERARAETGASTPEVSPAARELAADLVTALQHEAPDDSHTWVRRKLELARRSKSWVELQIEVPRREPVELVLLPLAVTDQRVRARDGDADVERTIPLRSILSVAEVPLDD